MSVKFAGTVVAYDTQTAVPFALGFLKTVKSFAPLKFTHVKFTDGTEFAHVTDACRASGLVVCASETRGVSAP